MNASQTVKFQQKRAPAKPRRAAPALSTRRQRTLPAAARRSYGARTVTGSKFVGGL